MADGLLVARVGCGLRGLGLACGFPGGLGLLGECLGLEPVGLGERGLGLLGPLVVRGGWLLVGEASLARAALLPLGHADAQLAAKGPLEEISLILQKNPKAVSSGGNGAITALGALSARGQSARAIAEKAAMEHVNPPCPSPSAPRRASRL